MKTSIARFLIPAALLLACVTLGAVAGRSAGAPARYRVTHLAQLGGTVSRGNSINNGGWISGYSNLAGNTSRHAALWLYGTLTDLGTLGGPNSSVAWPVKNETGLIAGIAQTATPEPLGENWSCAAFFPGATATGKTCLGFVWKWGVMRALPTLGGNNGFAAGANNRGQVSGWAENAVHDPTCTPPQVLQFHAVVWGPGRSQIRDLPPLTGDSSSAATGINDRGQVIGISGTCDQAVGRLSAKHAVIWENGTPTEIGDLGGPGWNTPMAINQRGDVVGFAGQPGDDLDNPKLRAFLWTRRDGIQDLGTLPGDLTSEAHAINERRQIVGVSCDAAGACRAVLWQNGTIVDLNSLVVAGYAGVLTNGQDINDFGEISGRAFVPATGERPAFVATPVGGRK